MTTRTDLTQFNRRIAEALGFVLGLSKGKYEWRETTECFYYFRRPTSLRYERICWADRLGRGYVLCVWKLPEAFDPASNSSHLITEEGWKEMFGGSIPYPGGGEYKALPETFCQSVTPELNANYIWAIDHQMQKSYEDQLERIMLEKKMEQYEAHERMLDATFDAMPAFMTSPSELQG
jgi:hypothetical protein